VSVLHLNSSQYTEAYYRYFVNGRGGGLQELILVVAHGSYGQGKSGKVMEESENQKKSGKNEMVRESQGKSMYHLFRHLCF